MSSSDVRSILNLPHAGPSSQQSRKQTFKRPDGISRELYALIGDNAPSLLDVQASVSAVKYREKPKTKGPAAKWQVETLGLADIRAWKMFTPAARGEEAARLGHWVRELDEPQASGVNYFGTFNNHGPSIMEYSQYEYDQHLQDSNWTPQETSYLFGLLKTYDLRFIVAADRYAYEGTGGVNKRSVEDIKDRYYTICRRLIRTRTASDPQMQQQMIQAHTFDKARETLRKQYASELFHLTAAEIAEEEALYMEIKRLEQNDKRYRADRDDLLRGVLGLDSGLVPVDSSNIEAVLGVNKKRKRPEDEQPPSPPPAPKENPAWDAARCITRLDMLLPKHPSHQPACLRSTKLPVPRANAAIRIGELLSELGISMNKLVMPTRGNIEELDALFGAAGALVDMKRQLDRVQQEIRMLKAQKGGFIPPVERAARSARSVSTDYL